MDARRSSTTGTSVRLRQITGVEHSDDGQDLSPIDESNIQNQNARSSNRGMSVGIQQMMGLEESGSRNNSDDPSLTNNINRHHRSSATAMSLRLQQIMGLEGVGSSSVGEDSSHGKNRNRHRRTSTLGSNLAMSARLQQIMGLEGLGNSSFGEDPGVKESNHETQDEAAAVDVDANHDVEEICAHDEHTTTTSNDEKKPNTQETGVEEIKDRWDKHRFYDWRKFMRKMDVVAFLRWLRDGETSPDTVEQTDVEIYTNLWCLARLVRLLRIYHQKYGVPKLGGAKDQEFVLREVTRDLYAGGCPVWVISPVMQRVAEGLTGKRGVEFFMLPRQAFIFAPSSGATILFKIARAFDVQLVTLTERIVVRLASFASNARSVASLPTREPTPRELGNALKLEIDTVSEEDLSKIPRDELVKQILDLGSESEGLFFFMNSRGLKKSASSPPVPNPSHQNDTQDDLEKGNLGSYSLEAEAMPAIDPQGSSDSKKSHHSEIFENLKQEVPLPKTIITPDPWKEVDPFWLIEEETSEVFSRLACQEALVSIENADKIAKPLYSFIPWRALSLFCSSAGAAIFWFNGSWIDGLLAGLLRLFVNFISGWSIFTREERVLLEAVASFFVGAAAGCVSITWPESTCADAIGIGGILSILQGFKVVYAVIELLSRQTVIGTANLFEAVLFTALVSFTLVGGQEVASLVLGRPADDLNLLCNDPINENWYFLLVPIGSISWSALYNPMYEDLPLMAFHGILAYAVSWSINVKSLYDGFSLFLSAAIVSLSAGLMSRFTGRSAMGNTLAGLNALVPGAFLVRLFQVNATDSLVLLGEALVRSGLIGLGAWTGTLLCSPVILGVSAAQAQRHAFQSNRPKPGSSVRERHVRVRGTGPVLFF